MEFDLSTFLLEALNFLILLWLLKRFFYQPVLQVIEKRQAAIEQVRQEAVELRGEAELLREQYEGRMAAWEKEKEQARSDLHEEIDSERSRLQAELRTELEEERERAQVLEQRRHDELLNSLGEQALATGSRFVAKLLEPLAGAELEAGLLGILLREVAEMPAQNLELLRRALADHQGSIKVASAYPLAEGQRAVLSDALFHMAQCPISPVFQEDPALLAGFRLTIGPWVLRANLQDELKFFAEVAPRVAR
ncbi:MAG: F0F1 ATP synthase subunit delta [Sulfuricella sp.]|nr:F0F1 ATP synthase subunit delta [Sulfuricella sp.]